MAVTINTNVPTLTAQRYLSKSTDSLSTAMERLSSGSRINSSKDDASGLQISNRLIGQSHGLSVAIRNGNDAISIAQTAGSAMTESSNLLHSMRDLALQAANSSTDADGRAAIQQDIKSSVDQINNIADTTSFGGKKLLNGTYGDAAFQIGSNWGETIHLTLGSIRADDPKMAAVVTHTAPAVPFSVGWTSPNPSSISFKIVSQDYYGKTVSQSISMTIPPGSNIEEVATYINGRSNGAVSASVDDAGNLQFVTKASSIAPTGSVSVTGLSTSPAGASTLVTVNQLDLTTRGNANAAIGILDQASSYMGKVSGDLGAIQNRLDSTIKNLTTVITNVDGANSRIRDTDFAKETVEMTKQQILQQTSTAVLAQAKQMPQTALNLLR